MKDTTRFYIEGVDITEVMPSFVFSAENKNFFQSICNDKNFLNDITIAASGFRRLLKLENERRPGREDLRGTLDRMKKAIREYVSIQDNMPLSLYKLFHETEQEMGFMSDETFFTEMTEEMRFYSRLQRKISVIGHMEERLKEEKTWGRRKMTAGLWLCGQVRDILKRHKVKVNRYRGGAWCRIFDRIFQVCNAGVSDPMNVLREFSRMEDRKKK